MPAFVDTHPSGSILGAGNLYLAPLTTSRTPISYVVTNTAVVALNATTMLLTASPGFTIRKGVVLNFNGVEVITTNSVALTSTATAVGITPAPASITILPATTINPAEILGLQTMGRPRKMNTVDIRSLKSGLGVEKRPVSIEFAFPMAGFVHQTDVAYRDIIGPASMTGNEVYAIFEAADNIRYKGPALIMDTDDPVEVDEIIKFSSTLMFQGIPIRETIV